MIINKIKFWILNKYKEIQESNDQQYKDKIKKLEQDKNSLLYQLTSMQKINEELSFKLAKKNTEILDLKDQCEKISQDFISFKEHLDEEEKLEKFWNNKVPKWNNPTYPARPVFNKKKLFLLDPRVFFTPYDDIIPEMQGKDNDSKAINALKLVHNLIKYTDDNKIYGVKECWAFPFETMILKKGDCDDGAILLANIMLKSGIPYWRIRINAGNVKHPFDPEVTVGHAYVTYLREKDNEWYILDWTYYYEKSVRWEKWKDAEKYLDIWFSFNQKYAFRKSDGGMKK